MSIATDGSRHCRGGECWVITLLVSGEFHFSSDELMMLACILMATDERMASGTRGGGRSGAHAFRWRERWGTT